MPDTRGLKPYSVVVQVCQVCGLIDAYLGDKHNCDEERARRHQLEIEWDLD
jgi:hypothetical protein